MSFRPSDAGAVREMDKDWAIATESAGLNMHNTTAIVVDLTGLSFLVEVPNVLMRRKHHRSSAREN